MRVKDGQIGIKRFEVCLISRNEATLLHCISTNHNIGNGALSNVAVQSVLLINTGIEFTFF